MSEILGDSFWSEQHVFEGRGFLLPGGAGVVVLGGPLGVGLLTRDVEEPLFLDLDRGGNDSLFFLRLNGLFLHGLGRRLAGGIALHIFIEGAARVVIGGVSQNFHVFQVQLIFLLLVGAVHEVLEPRLELLELLLLAFVDYATYHEFIKALQFEGHLDQVLQNAARVLQNGVLFILQGTLVFLLQRLHY